MQFFDAGMRRGGKEKLRGNRRPGMVEGRLWVAESRDENREEKGIFAKDNLRGLEFFFLLQIFLKYLMSGEFSSFTVIGSVAGAQSNLWLESSKILGSINRGIVLRVKEVIIHSV